MKKRSSKKVVRPQKGGNYKKQSRAKVDPREREVITAEEYDLLTSRPHSKADLAYINADHASTSSDHDPFYSDDPEFDVSVKELREIDTACLEYFEKYGEKSEFNPDDVGVDYSDKVELERTQLLIK